MAKHPHMKFSLASHVEHHSSRALNIDIRVLKTLIVSFTSRFLQLDWKRVNYLFGQMTMYLASETYERDAAVVRVSNSEYGIQRRRQVDAKRSKQKRAAALLLFKKFPTHLTLTFEGTFVIIKSVANERTKNNECADHHNKLF